MAGSVGSMTPDLLTPGPTPYSPAVRRAIHGPLLHQETPEFWAIFGEVLEHLQWAHDAPRRPIVFSGSITNAMTTVVTNLTVPGDDVIVTTNGYFGARWGIAARRWGCTVHELTYDDVPQGPASVDGLRQMLLRGLRPKAALLVHSETATGAVSPIVEMARTIREISPDTLICIDAATSFAAMPVPLTGFGLDVVLSGSQKALGCPVGVSWVALSERAFAASAQYMPGFGRPLDHDWAYLDQFQDTKGLYTPAILTFCALQASLRELRTQGLDLAYARVAARTERIRVWAHAAGLDVVGVGRGPQAAVCIRTPDGVDGPSVIAELAARHGVLIADAPGELAGRVFRFGTIGHIEDATLMRGLRGLGEILAERDALGVGEAAHAAVALEAAA